MRKTPLVIAITLFALALFGQEFGTNRSTLIELASKFELKATNQPPEWAQRQDKPLFQMAWMCDMHIESQQALEFNAMILRQIREKIHPIALIVGGDSWGLGNTPVKRQERFRNFLLENLGDDIGTIVIPGDNWPQGFDKVFGPSKFAFTVGGFRFICSAMDMAGSKNGCSVFSLDTFNWLKTQLNQAGKAPVIYIQHEPVEPPMTISSPKLAEMLDNTPNAILALGGHMHLDLAFSRKHWQQWVCPSTIPKIKEHSAFKVISFYRDAIICQNWQKEADSNTFSPVNKFLQVTIPAEFRDGLSETQKFTKEDFQAMPPRGLISDPELDAYSQELTQRLLQFAMRFAMKSSL